MARVDTHQCRKRFITQVIKYENCLPRRIFTHSCEGSCTTRTYLSETNPFKITRTCYQCKEAVAKERKVKVLCPDRDGLMPYMRKVIAIQVPQKCQCEQCSFLSVETAKDIKWWRVRMKFRISINLVRHSWKDFLGYWRYICKKSKQW